MAVPSKLYGRGLVAATAVVASLFVMRPSATPPANVQFQRITDSLGFEESPAISPDGKTVAFVARSGKRRQVWIKLFAGGTPLQTTRDDADHEQPRWTQDSGALIFYTPTSNPGGQGAIWEISALGGKPRRIASALGSSARPFLASQ